METFGSLLDKYSIQKIKIEKMKQSSIDANKIILVEDQINNLKNEINDYISSAINGDIILQEPKYKFYQGENPSGLSFINISDAIDNLFKTNYTLWNLEDKRRDKNAPDSDIRIICDDVAKFNRIRNDSMDKINELFNSLVNK
jgi:hypothetical protein